MHETEVLRSDRFARRAQLLNERRFHRLDVQFRELQEIPQNPNLQEYLYIAGIDVKHLDSVHALRGRIAFFPDFTFVHAIVPRITIVWRRDRLSIGRALVLLVREGGLKFPDEAPVVMRHPGAYLVLPGETPVEITAPRAQTEVVYFSVPARFVRDVFNDWGEGLEAKPLPYTLLAPMYSFAVHLCALSLTDIDDPSPLQAAAEEVARSTIRLIIGTPKQRVRSLFGSGVDVILNEYPDRTLNSEFLARRLNVSTRKVQLAFQAEGTTVFETIRRVRASAATRLSQEQPHLRRARIAELTGFGSVDSLKRAWRSVRPSEHPIYAVGS